MRAPGFQQVASRQRRSWPDATFLFIGPLLLLVGSWLVVFSGNCYVLSCCCVCQQLLAQVPNDKSGFGLT